MAEREKFGSRLGFILISAGSAIGLGNIWRFPYITGQYGGLFFILIYLACLVLFGIPIMTMEFAVGRASHHSVAKAANVLEPKGSKWHWYSWVFMGGNYLLMMYYTVIAGWVCAYFWKTLMGGFDGLGAGAIKDQYNALMASPGQLVFWMAIVTIIAFGLCFGGLQKSVERVTKVMMSLLFIFMFILVIRSVTLPGAAKGIEFYLKPSLAGFKAHGVWTTVYAAMGQAFFTLSIGQGGMAMFGSYLDKDRRLTGESITVTVLDTIVALMAGLIIFPACFNYGVDPGQGPSLIFITLPNIFNQMPLGRLWGTFFFIFVLFAALSTIIADVENYVGYAQDVTGCSRQKAVVINCIVIIVLAIPCCLGYNLWKGFNIPHIGNVLSFEDFLVSDNLMPIGAIVFVLFCCTRYGWSWNKFVAEVDSGRKGAKWPSMFKPYFQYILPLVIFAILVMGYINQFIGF